MIYNIMQAPIEDDSAGWVQLNDATGGINSRQYGSKIARNQFANLDNVDIGTPGERNKRPGTEIIGNDIGNNACKDLINFERQNDTDYLIMAEGTKLYSWKSGDATWTERVTGLTDTTYGASLLLKESGLVPDDIVIYQNGTDNAQRLHFNTAESFSVQDLGSTAGSGTDSPPKSRVMGWYNNRLWILKDDLLYYSTAYPTDYSTAFDTVTGSYRIPVGEERAIVSSRNQGMVIFGKLAVWALSPSVTPSANDQPEPITTSFGCVANKSVVPVGDDIYWLAQDGVRSLRRTEQDKLVSGASYPMSYLLKEQYDSINWAYIEKACAVYFDNKYFLALPTGSSQYNNKVWVYYPATQGWVTITGWNVGSWAKYKVDGDERLYYCDANDGKVYHAWKIDAYTDNGTTITVTEESRKEDMQEPLRTKNGGEIEIEALAASGDFSYTVSVSLDDADYEILGTMSLQSATAPTLPVSLPFQLGAGYIVRQKFHLDSLGSWRTLQVKLVNNDDATEVLKIYNVNIITYREEYDNE